MKNFILLASLLLILSPNMSRAELVDSTNYGTGMETGSGGEPVKKTFANPEKKFNLMFEPIFLLVGYVDIAADFKLSPNWTLGPVASYWHATVGDADYYYNRVSLESFALGVRGTWHANGVFEDGLYVSPALKLISAKATTTSVYGENFSASVTALDIVGDVGYHWFWDNFNLRLGAGLSILTAPSKIHVQSSNTTDTQDVSYDPAALGLDVDFMLGWSF